MGEGEKSGYFEEKLRMHNADRSQRVSKSFSRRKTLFSAPCVLWIRWIVKDKLQRISLG